MKYILSTTLILLLTGCGGGSPITSTQNQNDVSIEKETNGKKEMDLSSLTKDKDGKIKTIKLPGRSKDIAVNKDTLYVAKGKDGIDIVKMGYHDQLSSELITAISGINANKVSISKDGKKLYAINNEGFVNIYDITNSDKPTKIRTTTQQEIKKETVSEDGSYKFIPKDEKGLKIYDISNPSNEKLISSFDKTDVYDIVLTDRDTKALVASGLSGIYLLDLTDITKPNLVVRFAIDGGTKGLSLDKKKGILYVANGDRGVLVYYLNMLLDKLTTK